MAQEGVIRNFMVALGFKTDNTGLGQMQSAMEGIDWQAKALKASLLALATGAIVAVRQTAGELDKLYFSSQRIGASVTNINAYGNAIAQLGGSAEGAVGSLESIAEKMRNSPGYESMIGGLGVATRDANGQMRDRVEVMKDLSGVLSKMPAYQANAYAESLGIDQNTLLAMRDGKFMSSMEKYQKIQKELGMNDDLAKSGNEFMTEYRDLTMMTKTGFQVLVMQAGKALIPILRLLNQLIQSGIQAFSQLNPQVKDMLGMGLRFAMLALVMGGFIKTFGMIFKFIPMLKGFIGLLKLFRLAFLASPIGIILALAAAIGLLYDDYKTWREGGKSLFDWSKWTEGIDFIIEKIQDFLDLLDKIKDKTIEFINKVINNPAEAFEELVDGAKETAAKVGEELANPTPDENGNVSKTRDLIAEGMDAGFGLVDKGLAFFGNDDAQQRVKQRERGEIGYQPQTTVVKEIATVATNTAKAVENAVKGVVKDVSQSSTKVIELIATKGTMRIYKMGDGTTETRTGGTVAWRNNNPGNLKFEFKGSADKTVKTKRTKEKALKDAQKRYEGVVALDQWGNAIFETMEAGAVAKAKLLKKRHGEKTYQQMLRGYAVDDYSGKTNYKGYEKIIRDTAASMGVNLEGKTIGQMSDKEFQALAAGMVKAEGVKKGEAKRTGKPKTEMLSKSSTNLANFAQNAEIPSSNPHKSQINSSNVTASNITVNQSFNTDMTLNGVSSPVESAQAVKRQQENSLVFMARGVKGTLA